MKQRVLCVVAVLLATVMAGCTSESGDTADGAIRVVSRPVDGAVDPLVLEATVSADEYRWNMGDGRVKPTGKTVEYVYGVTDATFRVELTTVTGGVEKKYAILPVTLGTGVNQAPSLTLELEWTWIQAGEETTLAILTDDPDGDPAYAQWFCQRKSDIAISSGGGHHGAAPGGLDFGTGSSSAIPVTLANGTSSAASPAAISGDLCASMGSSTYTEQTAIRGAFAESGIYEITVLAKDAANPGVSTTTTLYVTDQARVERFTTVSLEGSIAFGAPSAADGPTGQAGAQDHIVAHPYTITYPTLSTQIQLSNDGGDGVPVTMTYAIFKGTTEKQSETSDSIEKGAAWMTAGDYTAIVYLRQGSNVGYTLEIVYENETDPAKIFEAPH